MLWRFLRPRYRVSWPFVGRRWVIGCRTLRRALRCQRHMRRKVAPFVAPADVRIEDVR